MSSSFLSTLYHLTIWIGFEQIQEQEGLLKKIKETPRLVVGGIIQSHHNCMGHTTRVIISWCLLISQLPLSCALAHRIEFVLIHVILSGAPAHRITTRGEINRSSIPTGSPTRRGTSLGKGERVGSISCLLNPKTIWLGA